MEARRLRDAFAVEVRSAGFAPLERGATVEQVADDALREISDLVARGEMSPRTAETYGASIRNHVKPFFPGRTIASVTPDDIAAWVDDQQASGAKAWSVRAHWTALRTVFVHAARQRLIPASPCDALKARERPGPGRARQRFLDDREIAALFDAASTTTDRVIVGLLVFCGVRASEALGLVWDDIDLEDGWVKVRFQMGRDGRRRPIKGDSDSGRRDVVLMDSLAGELRRLRRERIGQGATKGADLVLVNTIGNTIGYWDLRDRFADMRDAAGLSGDVTPHACRHTYASILIARGRPIEFVSRQLGHSKISTTQDVYVHLLRRREHAEAMRSDLNDGYGRMLGGAS